MAAGPITLIIKDSQGFTRQAQFWSSDGTVGGYLMPLQHLDPDQLAAVTSALAPLGTSAKQDAIIAGLSSIDGHVDGLEGLSASILAKLSADPATQTTLAAVLAKLSSDPATQTTLAAVLAAVQGATPAGENHLGEVGGNTAIVGNSIMRPANSTPYALGQLVANSTIAGSVTPINIAAARKNAGTGRVLRARLSKTTTSLTNASFRVHLFKTAPTTTSGDGAAFSGVAGVAAIHLGYVDITMDVAFSDGAKGVGAPAVGSCISFDAPSGTTNISALIEARAAYTPGSAETFTLALEVDRD